MLMSEDTRIAVNELIGACFDFNAKSDNIAYNLGYYDFKSIEGIYHSVWAHHWPDAADSLSDMMLSLDARPVRTAVPAYSEDFNGNLIAMFDENYKAVTEFREKALRTLELAELNGDTEVKLALEDFVEDLVPYRKQAEIWARYAHRYEGNEKSFEQRFDKITSVIGGSEDDDD